MDMSTKFFWADLCVNKKINVNKWQHQTHPIPEKKMKYIMQHLPERAKYYQALLFQNGVEHI